MTWIVHSSKDDDDTWHIHVRGFLRHLDWFDFIGRLLSRWCDDDWLYLENLYPWRFTRIVQGNSSSFLTPCRTRLWQPGSPWCRLCRHMLLCASSGISCILLMFHHSGFVDPEIYPKIYPLGLFPAVAVVEAARGLPCSTLHWACVSLHGLPRELLRVPVGWFREFPHLLVKYSVQYCPWVSENRSEWSSLLLQE